MSNFEQGLLSSDGDSFTLAAEKDGKITERLCGEPISNSSLNDGDGPSGSLAATVQQGSGQECFTNSSTMFGGKAPVYRCWQRLLGTDSGKPPAATRRRSPCFPLYSWTALLHKSGIPRWRGKAKRLSSQRQQQCFTAVISWRQGVGSKVEGSDETCTVIAQQRCFSSPLLR